MDKGITLKTLAGKLGRPYAQVLKAAHEAGVVTKRGVAVEVDQDTVQKIKTILAIVEKPKKAETEAKAAATPMSKQLPKGKK